MDIDNNGDGDISNGDCAYLSLNWLREAGAPDLFYPVPKAADTVFAQYESADLDVDQTVF